MTPQERQLIAELFDRLASLESSPRDPDAERAIAEGLQHAPHGTYALVQTVLLQDEALRRCHSRIQELEGGPAEEPSRGFLDSMRESLFGRDEPRGSVPPVRQGGAGTSGVWGQPGGGPGSAGTTGAWGQPGGAPPQAGPAPGMAPMGPSIGTGGSFLGNAASTAAGVIGGAMLLNGIRSMFGPHAGGSGGLGSGAAVASPFGGGGSAANSDLARDAGLNDIGRDRTGARDDDTSRTGLFGNDDQDDGDPLGDDDDGDGDAGDDSDFDGGDTEDV